MTDCAAKYVVGSEMYYWCLNVNGVFARYFGSGGGGSPIGKEALRLVDQFRRGMGLDEEIPLPDGQQPDVGNLVSLVDGLRDLGELDSALKLSNIVTDLLAKDKLSNISVENLQSSLQVRAKILNGLGQGDEAFHTLNLITVVNRMIAPQVAS